jgi:hypothetical protein
MHEFFPSDTQQMKRPGNRRVHPCGVAPVHFLPVRAMCMCPFMRYANKKSDDSLPVFLAAAPGSRAIQDDVDMYIALRTGALTSDFHTKPAQTQHLSGIAGGEWIFACRTPMVCATKQELHIVLMRGTFTSPTPPIAEIRIPVFPGMDSPPQTYQFVHGNNVRTIVVAIRRRAFEIVRQVAAAHVCRNQGARRVLCKRGQICTRREIRNGQGVPRFFYGALHGSRDGHEHIRGPRVPLAE